jgi:hypothetical protein
MNNLWWVVLQLYDYIQGDAGGVDSMGHCKKKVLMSVCLILHGYRGRPV